MCFVRIVFFLLFLHGRGELLFTLGDVKKVSPSSRALETSVCRAQPPRGRVLLYLRLLSLGAKAVRGNLSKRPYHGMVDLEKTLASCPHMMAFRCWTPTLITPHVLGFSAECGLTFWILGTMVVSGTGVQVRWLR
uniref:Secreted protein n=1 Tax=Scleropages formosus TaxID=113540 RepID=A0A8C9UYL3_SCLFO